MSDPASFAQRFGNLPGLRLETDASGVALLQVEAARARATLCLQGAQLLRWQPLHTPQPVLWVSEQARPVAGKSLRGGVPICWPWFGPAAAGGTLPAHGIARNLDWDIAGIEPDADGRIQIVLRLDEQGVQRGMVAGRISEAWRAAWPEGCELELKCTIGCTLVLELTTRNRGGASVVLGEALHTYFQVGDVNEVAVRGLDGRPYDDRLLPGAPCLQQGDVLFSGEVDRVYADDQPRLTIDDPRLGRRIHLEKSGSGSTVVWSPGAEKAARLGDVAAGHQAGEGWRAFICVETANAMGAVVHLAPGATHSLTLEVQVEST